MLGVRAGKTWSSSSDYLVLDLSAGAIRVRVTDECYELDFTWHKWVSLEGVGGKIVRLFSTIVRYPRMRCAAFLIAALST